jgi:hypothetical protein
LGGGREQDTPESPSRTRPQSPRGSRRRGTLAKHRGPLGPDRTGPIPQTVVGVGPGPGPAGRMSGRLGAPPLPPRAATRHQAGLQGGVASAGSVAAPLAPTESYSAQAGRARAQPAPRVKHARPTRPFPPAPRGCASAADRGNPRPAGSRADAIVSAGHLGQRPRRLSGLLRTRTPNQHRQSGADRPRPTHLASVRHGVRASESALLRIGPRGLQRLCLLDTQIKLGKGLRGVGEWGSGHALFASSSSATTKDLTSTRLQITWQVTTIFFFAAQGLG